MSQNLFNIDLFGSGFLSLTEKKALRVEKSLKNYQWPSASFPVSGPTPQIKELAKRLTLSPYATLCGILAFQYCCVNRFKRALQSDLSLFDVEDAKQIDRVLSTMSADTPSRRIPVEDVSITSAYRHSENSPKSAHNYGLALDFHWSGLDHSAKTLYDNSNVRAQVSYFLQLWILATRILPDQTLLGTHHLHLGIAKISNFDMHARSEDKGDSIEFSELTISGRSTERAGYEFDILSNPIASTFDLGVAARYALANREWKMIVIK